MTVVVPFGAFGALTLLDLVKATTTKITIKAKRIRMIISESFGDRLVELCCLSSGGKAACGTVGSIGTGDGEPGGFGDAGGTGGLGWGGLITPPGPCTVPGSDTGDGG